MGAWGDSFGVCGGGSSVCGSTNIRTKLQVPVIKCEIGLINAVVVVPVITAKIIDINHKKRVIS